MWCLLRLFLGSHIASLKEAGWSQEKLAAARAYADADSIHTSAVMIVQGGKVVDQWGDINQKIDCYSIRKSLLSALYGIYSAEGAIDISQQPTVGEQMSLTSRELLAKSY
jgi:hypothetical protein